MTQQIIILLISGLFAAGVFLLVAAFAYRRGDALRGRLEHLGGPTRPRVQALEEIELAKPFTERVILPLLEMLSRAVSRLAPGSTSESVATKLAMAGNPRHITVEQFLGLKVVLTVGMGLLSLLFQFLLPPLLPSPTIMTLTIYTVVAAAIGFFLPELWIRDEIGKRRKAVLKVLPDTIDVLSISVEAGLGFDAAISRICQKSQTALTLEFEKYLTEIRLGKSRREALRMIQTRAGVEDLNSFISAIIQADQLGVSIAKILRMQSEQLRTKRRQRAEQLAQQAPLKMLFPMILFIFPSVFVVILGPAVKTITESFH